MALEQSVNRDTKTKGGIIGISKHPGALSRWFLKAHERASATTATKRMAGLDDEQNMPMTQKHKESGSKHRMHDEKDVQKIITTVVSQMLNPFTKDQSPKLCNITTRIIASDIVERDLTSASELGKRAMTSFVDERLQKGTTPFYDRIHKMN